MRAVKLFASIFFLVIFATPIQAQESKSIDTWKKGIVSINNNLMRSAYDSPGIYLGSGFIIDKKNGIIATNKHVVDGANVNESYITFFNGREIKASMFHSDPINDFTFLKVDPSKIPADAIDFKFNSTLPSVGDNVTIIGNNEGQSFSVQNGLITSVYETSSYFPIQSLRISLNTRGGSSGSPILNSKGEVIALNFAVDNTFAYAIPSRYLELAHRALSQNQKPKRRSTGALLGYYSLDKAARFHRFPEKEIDTYLQKFPKSLSQAIVVSSTLLNTPASDKLFAGDILWKINGEMIGPDMQKFDEVVSANEKVKLEIYREGNIVPVELETYDLYKNTIKRMVIFEGAVFYEVDDLTKLLHGVDNGSVMFMNADRHSGFFNIQTITYGADHYHAVKIVQMDKFKINNLDDLIKAIPELVKKGEFATYYQNLVGYVGYDASFFVNRGIEFVDIRHSDVSESATLLEFDEASKTWKSKKI